MKVFNLTNVETEKLKRYRMQGHTIAVGKYVLEPGASVDIPPEDEAVIRAHLEHFLEVGAIAIDLPEPPAAEPKAQTLPPPKYSHAPPLAPPRRTNKPPPEE